MIKKTLLDEYRELFNDQLGEINNYDVKLELKPDAVPVFCRSRPLPFALKNRIEQEIDRLEAEGIIEKVETSDWAIPVVTVVNRTGAYIYVQIILSQ